ncbi:glycoside hydrolase family 43 protein [Prevotella sp. E13-17]|uniref:glycoside hydrolase family 43 protein n=1 Tax=Prevotella sp. E13-17 TaxID=2913616 RepID=UPI001EDC826F|nr:glycoside hydrolase family 43 protein [Prevotella sp. E13-17]UKK51669.1 glycoside hydrolase family 43 protein [Prevotella sp. E13-17]
MKTAYFLIGILSFASVLLGCDHHKDLSGDNSKLVFAAGYYPQVAVWNQHYYYTMQIPSADSIILWKSDSPETLAQGERQCVWHADSMQHIWSPEIHRINNKWYIYFEADGGNTDFHQLYVLENSSADPLKGKFELKGAIVTNEEWNFGLHPTSVQVRGQQYLLWSGWPHRRKETETQCIYMAKMENPWTLGSERVMLSEPEYEWERQWINPDGLRSNYPIYVNENPEAFITPDGRYVCVCYSASGIWTVYHSLGMLYARTDADLLDPASWTKVEEPLFRAQKDTCIYWLSSNVCVFPSADGHTNYMLYESRWLDSNRHDHRDVRIKSMSFNEEGLPEFGQP